MGWPTLFGLAVALAMDAFAVSLVTGVTLPVVRARHVVRVALHFGAFQAGMPILGWWAGNAVHTVIEIVDHWVAFALLVAVGSKMAFEAWNQEEPDSGRGRDRTRGLELLLLSVATSIDALAVGLSLAMLGEEIARPAVVIGAVTALLSASGVLLGRRLGTAWGKRMELVGGLVLVALGVKIVLDHTVFTVG